MNCVVVIFTGSAWCFACFLYFSVLVLVVAFFSPFKCVYFLTCQTRIYVVNVAGWQTEHWLFGLVRFTNNYGQSPGIDIHVYMCFQSG